MTLNSSKKLIAFAEYGERPLVIIFDLETNKRRKVLRCSEFKSHKVTLFIKLFLNVVFVFSGR